MCLSVYCGIVTSPLVLFMHVLPLGMTISLSIHMTMVKSANVCKTDLMLQKQSHHCPLPTSEDERKIQATPILMLFLFKRRF